jgi:hypothetical protein
MVVLGLDPSLRNLGWLQYSVLGIGPAKVLAKGRLHTDKGSLFIERYIYLREALRHLLRTRHHDKVGIEHPIYGEAYSEGMYGLFLYLLEALFGERDDVVFLGPKRTKAHAREFMELPTTWEMGKSDMIKAASKDTGRTGWSSDEADAYWVAKVAARFWMFRSGRVEEGELTRVERRSFCQKRTVRKTGKVKRSGLIFRESDQFFLWSEIETSEVMKG